MYTTYHLDSAQDINNDIIDSIKAAFRSKPIKIVITEDEVSGGLEEDLINALEERMSADDNEFISAEESLSHLTKKYGL